MQIVLQSVVCIGADFPVGSLYPQQFTEVLAPGTAPDSFASTPVFVVAEWGSLQVVAIPERFEAANRARGQASGFGSLIAAAEVFLKATSGKGLTGVGFNRTVLVERDDVARAARAELAAVRSAREQRIGLGMTALAVRSNWVGAESLKYQCSVESMAGGAGDEVVVALNAHRDIDNLHEALEFVLGWLDLDEKLCAILGTVIGDAL